MLPQGVLLHLGRVIVHLRAPWAEVPDHPGGARPAPTADGAADGQGQPAPPAPQPLFPDQLGQGQAYRAAAHVQLLAEDGLARQAFLPKTLSESLAQLS
ncbi:MAG TPA: hypothetical protein PKM43_19095, partial [Verrucomicrobiota bacterium]|nr:hypothetical protein [Verrucomicrobiota bacterium]